MSTNRYWVRRRYVPENHILGWEQDERGFLYHRTRDSPEKKRESSLSPKVLNDSLLIKEVTEAEFLLVILTDGQIRNGENQND